MADDGVMIECPADGCDYRGVKKSVIAHHSGKQDDAHAGGYHDAKQRINDASSGDAGEPDGGRDHDPVPAEIPEAPDEGDSSTTDVPECPACGSTSHVADAGDVARNQGHALGDEHVELLRGSDYVCGECGGVWDE